MLSQHAWYVEPSNMGQQSAPLAPRLYGAARQRACALHCETGVGLALGDVVGRAVVGTVVGADDGASVGGGTGDVVGVCVSTVGAAVGAAVTGAGVGALSQHSWYVRLSSIGQHRDRGVSRNRSLQSGR